MNPRRSVLLMHSDKERLAAIQNVLSSEYEILGVNGRDAALGVLASRSVDVLLADGTLAAREFLEQVERTAPNVLPVVLADSTSINGLMDVFRDDSFCLSIQKPESPDRILQHLRTLLFPRSEGRQAVGDLTAEVHLEQNQALRLPVFDISNRGFSFYFGSAGHLGRLLPGTRLQPVLLRRGAEPIGSFSAVVRSVVPLIRRDEFANGAGKFKVGAEFMSGPHPEAEGAVELISDPLRIAVLLRGALRRGRLIGQLVDSEAPALHFQSGVVDAVDRTLTLNGDNASEFFGGDILQGSFSSAGRNFTFLTVILSFDSGKVLLRLPRTVRASVRREKNRFTLTYEKRIEVEIESLLGQRIQRTAIDVSAWGVALPISHSREILPVGTVLDQVRLRFPDGTNILVRGRVRSLVPLRHKHDGLETPFKCGIQFEGLTFVERVRIANAMLQLGDGRVQDSDGLSFHDIWKLLEDTGFLYPEKVERLKPALPQIQQTIETLLNRPNRVFKALVYRREQTLEGHLSAFRAYRRTWVIQHLAARRNIAARMLNLGLVEYFDQMPQLEWIRVFFRVNNQWPARVFGTFAQRVRDPSLFEMVRFNYLVAPIGDVSLPAKYEVHQATLRDLTQIEEYFVERRRLISLDADDLYSAALPLTELALEYTQLGLRREREALVVRDGRGNLLGFALVEISSPGLNLSELTNAFRIYTVDGNPEVKQALIQAARRRYHAEGRQICIALAEDADLFHFEKAGFTKTKEYTCWTSHRTLLQKYYEYIVRLYRQERPRSEAATR